MQLDPLTTPAMYESMSGLLPVKIVAVCAPQGGTPYFKIKMRKNGKGWKAGEETQAPITRIIPTSCIRKRKHGTIVLPHEWKVK